MIGDVPLAELAGALYPVQEALEREINPKLYRPKEWTALVAGADAFARELLRESRIELIGDTV
ncbi:MAG: hypothetical protein WBN82_02660 [Porticoccaceae bacterium]